MTSAVGYQNGRDCAQCGQAIDALALDAIYCSSACRQRAYRKRNKHGRNADLLEPQANLRRRYDAALRVISCDDFDTPALLDLLAAVCWPDSERLRAVS
jgi:hypothetical protein